MTEPTVQAEQAGTYRQIAHRLRIQRGPGRPDLVSERPRNKSGRYLDSAAEPTLVTFDSYCQVDVDSLLRNGGIQAFEPPRKEVPRGQTQRQ